jgi:hypothetical protein
MSIEQILLLGLSIGFSVLGWFARELWSAVQTLRKDLGDLTVEVGREYVRYDRLQDKLAEIMSPVTKQLDRIEQALTHKVDK